MAKLKDKLWLWGQDAGSHHAAVGNKSWKLPGENRMGPAEGAAYMGIKNIFRVVMGGGAPSLRLIPNQKSFVKWTGPYGPP